MLQRPTKTAWAALALALAALAILTAAWPDWTLRYIQALAWPTVVLIAVAAFGPALARRVPALSALHLPGGVKATFEPEPQRPQDLEAVTAAPDHAQRDAVEDVIPRDPVADRLNDATEIIGLLGTIVGAYQMQLDFLRALDSAEHGLTMQAARKFFEDEIRSKGGDPAGWNVDDLIGWLTGQGAITLTPDGTYTLTEFGRRVVAGLATPGLFVAPKAI